MSELPSKPFSGLRVVLHECNRRAAVSRCLSSVRWLAMRGAEVVLIDGTHGGASADQTASFVRRRFPFVEVLQLRVDVRVDIRDDSRDDSRSVDAHDLRQRLLAPLSLNSVPPRWIFKLSADLEVDRFRMQDLLRELSEQPVGTCLVPSLVGPDGRACSAPNEHVGQGAGSATTWLARRRDLAVRSASLLWVNADTSLLVSRPAEAVEHTATGADAQALPSSRLEPRIHGGGLHHAEA